MISKKMAEALKGGSEIRKMFEEGGRLKDDKHSEEKQPGKLKDNKKPEDKQSGKLKGDKKPEEKQPNCFGFSICSSMLSPSSWGKTWALWGKALAGGHRQASPPAWRGSQLAGSRPRKDELGQAT